MDPLRLILGAGVGVGICTRTAEFRLADGENDDGYNLRGYAAVFDQETEIRSWEGDFIETLAKGAFKKTLKERKGKIQMQYDHGRDIRVGTTPIGYYRDLQEDDHGLDVDGRLHQNDVVEPVRQAIESGAIYGMSFKFRVIRDEWRDQKGKLVKPEQLLNLLWGGDPERTPLRRTIKEVQLFEAGPVSTPAYDGTSVGVRSADDLDVEDRSAIVAGYAKTMFVEDEDRTDEDVEPDEVEDVEPDEDRKDTKKDGDKKPYGDVDYADPGYQKDGKKRYPLDTKEHVKAAWSYINMPKNAEKYTSEQLSKIKSKIKAAAKKFGIELDAEKKSSENDDAARTGTSQGSEPPDTDAAPAGTSEQAPPTPITRKVIPMTLAELLARAAELREKLASLNDEFDGAEMPEERQSEWDEADTELRGTLGKIKAIQDRQERVKELAETGQVERTTPPATPKRSQRYGDGPNVHRGDDDLFDLSEIRKDTGGDPEAMAERMTTNARKAIETMRFSRAAGSREKAQERVSELLDEDTDDARLARRILVCGSPLYERAFSKALRASNIYGLSPEEARVMQEGVDADGGYMVPAQLDPTIILTNDGHIGDLRRISRVETIVGAKWQGITSDGISVSRDGTPGPGEIGRAAELQEVSDASFKLEQPEVTVTRVQGFVPFSIEIDQDWNGLRSEITRMLVDAKGREENESFVLGDGNNRQPLGVIGGLPAESLVPVGATFDSADIYAMESELAPRWRQNAKWLANKSTYNTVRQFAEADGHDLWERIGAGLPPRLLGYEVHENSFAPSMGTTTGTYRFMVFGDFQQFLIVDRAGMSVELVPHVFGPNGRPTGQRGVYAIWRNNAAVLVPEAFRAFTNTVA